MAHKIIGTGTTVAIAVGTGSTSIPIALQSGYIRIAPSVAAHVGLASTATEIATLANYYVPAGDVAILKERVASSVVSAATTGSTTTVYSFRENAGNPFLAGDYVTVTGSAVTNYNCTHALITSVNTTPGSESVSVTFNTAAADAFTGTADIRKSIVVNTIGSSAGYAQISQIQITSNA